MARDEILSMEPGRELDVLVAKKVMKWEYFPAQATGMFVRLGYFFDPVSGEAHHHWSPSTDISAAWEVVERMTSLFWEMNLDTGSKSNTTKVEFYRTFDQEFHVVVANTAPEAICKAALLAVMGEC